VRATIDRELAPDGYNVGWNSGVAAGQEVFHAHMHVIPRFGDEPLAGKGIGTLERAACAGPRFHLAFSAPSRESVDRFHASALRHGATDDGRPGLRRHYGPGYYAAFIIDLDGHRIEAVINDPVAAGVF